MSTLHYRRIMYSPICIILSRNGKSILSKKRVIVSWSCEICNKSDMSVKPMNLDSSDVPGRSSSRHRSRSEELLLLEVDSDMADVYVRNGHWLKVAKKESLATTRNSVAKKKGKKMLCLWLMTQKYQRS